MKLWDGILALPLIGTLDSARTQVVMENLLQTIVDQNAEIAIIDITGVPTVDTLVAQHLLKTVAAARLMGADCIICGIRPQIAQTIVHLGVELNVTSKATLADALPLALQRTGAGRRAGRRPSGRGPEPDGSHSDPQAGRFLLVTIQVDMHDRLAMALEDDLTSRIVATARKGVLIDISALEIVDSFIGRMLDNIAADVAHARRRDRGGRDAAGGRDHARRARPVADGRQDGAERRAGHGADRRRGLRRPRSWLRARMPDDRDEG